MGIDSPFDYRKEARGLLTELGIDPQKLAAESDQLADRTGWRGLQLATFFDMETFGEDRLVIGSPAGAGRGARGRGGEAAALAWQEWLAKNSLF